MIIVPVVEGLNWRRPPPVTVALILLNCLVFLFYQSGDTARAEKAVAAYSSSTLPALEIPAYRQWLSEKRPELARQARAADPEALIWHMTGDEGFMRELHDGRVVTPQNPRYARWKEDRARFEALANQVSFRRYGFVPSDPRPATWITSMFLHGSLMHLVGNMVFLFIVGVAVESALGGFWYLLLYLATGIAGDALHMLVHPASTMPSVGASGAISGLMGLFTVVFGLRKVNFFYWVFFLFGFRKMHGIVVLPIWIGWEIFQQIRDRDGEVSYMAHAGGLIAGALLGFAVTKRLSGGRVEEFHVEREQEEFDKAEYERARALVSNLDYKKASDVFARLARRFPAEMELLKQWYAIAKSDTSSDAYHEVASRILSVQKVDASQRAFQKQVFTEYFERARPAPRLDAKVLGGVGIAFARSGDLPEAERAAEALLKLAPGEPRLAVLWEALAIALGRAAGDEASLQKAKRYRALVGAQAKARLARPV